MKHLRIFVEGVIIVALIIVVASLQLEGIKAWIASGVIALLAISSMFHYVKKL
jgi:hypothetical protein